MKYIKIYEKIKKPEVGDYILANVNFFDEKYIKFLNENIGQIVKIYPQSEHENEDKAMVEYKKRPEEDIWYMFYSDALERNIYNTSIWVKNIVAFSKRKEDLEMILAGKKYNL